MALINRVILATFIKKDRLKPIYSNEHVYGIAHMSSLFNPNAATASEDGVLK